MWAATNFGTKLVAKSHEYSEEAVDEANKKAVEWGLNSTWNNKADAYRHFIWNVKMTRDSGVGYYGARNITNRHEYETMLNNGWVSENGNSFDYKKDNTIISGKMNQETLMDLWNNQVGRELANNKDFRDKTESELFDLAMYWELLITDANTVYKKLGIENYVGDDYLVETDWNLTTGEVTVRNKWGRKRLKIGV